MSLINELDQLKNNNNLNYKNNHKITMILNKLSTDERQALFQAIQDNVITAQSIADLLLEYGHSISADSIRRHRRRLNNGSN